MPDTSTYPLIARTPSPSPNPSGVGTGTQVEDYNAPTGLDMAYTDKHRHWRSRARHTSAWVIASGVLDWLLIVATGVGGFYLGEITPNKRPFQLENPNISFPFTVHETVTSRNLIIATVAVPVVVIAFVSLVSVPGLSVPPGTPRALVWRRKLWELYASLLSFGLGMASQWFIINGLKNICGKPRPDLLARCQPDLANVAQYVVGGIANITSNGQLVSSDICTNTDTYILNDGFRSYPSGHSSSSAAGLGHLALFLAYKLGVVFPFSPPLLSREVAALSATAFPSRNRISALQNGSSYELQDISHPVFLNSDSSAPGRVRGSRKDMPQAGASMDYAFTSARRAGAAPPLYLLVIVLSPLFSSVFIAATRWYNFRHHGFDIIFGYTIGTITTLVAFRMYHLPLSQGAGWAWGPRSVDKAFWAGIGSNSWAEPWGRWTSDTRGDGRGFELTAPRNDGVCRSPPSQGEGSSRRRVTHDAAGDDDNISGNDLETGR